ncbi:hypothetical protein THSYN_15725 [Candidatus Thiodictyon syntrophicum]|uniref:Uncharacterized protein n=2 Tax=Candidatus Thiodictyon syntrophicum TaxID=1166950 RepID=A0A2K8U9L3_9GAMM|nr:hypothetical protein THSYN_15725 [Candidatus Thiodictyon syntrophicum]
MTSCHCEMVVVDLLGEKRKPTCKPSGMEEETAPEAPPPEDGKTGADGARSRETPRLEQA